MWLGSGWRMDDLVEYYKQVASEYDKYDLPTERAVDVRLVEKTCRGRLSDKSLLEVACGTGRWTAYLSTFARHVVATDISQEMLTIACWRNQLARNTHFVQTDCYTLPFARRTFNGAFAGWWLSHVPKQVLPEFLHKFHSCLQPGSPVVLADDIKSVGDTVCGHDQYGNMYVRRRLANGKAFKVRKNFYNDLKLREILQTFATQIVYAEGYCHWVVCYVTKTLPVHYDLADFQPYRTRGSRYGT